jgi:hypothetical protein
MNGMNSKTIILLNGLAAVLRLTSKLCAAWFCIAALLLFACPRTVHIRTDMFGERAHAPCTYLGARGFINTSRFIDCPLLVIINPETERRYE